MQGGMKKSRFSTNIPLYLANDARQSHSYYGRPMETAPKLSNGTGFNDLDRVTSNSVSRSWYHSTSNNSKTVPDRAI